MRNSPGVRGPTPRSSVGPTPRSHVPTPRSNLRQGGSLIATLNSPATRTSPRNDETHRSLIPQPTVITAPQPFVQPPPSATDRTAILNALTRCLNSRRHLWLSRVLAGWRLSLSHILRHQSLQRLLTQSQHQQKELSTLKRTLPISAPPRPDHPSGAGGVLLTPSQQATQPPHRR